MSTCGGCSVPVIKNSKQSLLLVVVGVFGGIAIGLFLGFLLFSGVSSGVSEPAPNPQPTPTFTTIPTPTTKATPTTATAPSFFPTSQEEELMLRLVNEVRQENGAGNLTWCPALVRSSLAHSQDMSRRNYFDHDSPDGGTIGDRASDAGYRFKSVGENIAFGQRDVSEVMEAWIDSPGHFKNLISTDFEHFGYADLNGRLDGSSGKFWTQNLGAGGNCD